MTFGNRGSVDWTIGRLIKIVLAVVFLALIIYGWTNQGFGPLLDNLEAKWEESIFLIGSFWGGDVRGCYEEDVSNFGGGDGLLLELGVSELRLEVCERVCNLSGGGFEYRVNRGRFEEMHEGEWVKESGVFFGEPLDEKFNWGLYHAGVDLLEGLNVRELYDEGLTREFVLTGDGGGWGDKPTVASWANGKWVVSVDGERSEVFVDDDAALAYFLTGVKDGYDDKVYWKIDGAEKADGFYLKSSSFGEAVGGLIGADAVVNGESYFSIDKIYRAFIAAEHRGHYKVKTDSFGRSYSPWIRTKAKGSESTAYGPVQLTKGLAEGYLKNGAIFWSEKEKEFLNRFIDQGWKFLAHGDMDSVVDKKVVERNSEVYARLGISVGDKYQSQYDYDGRGDMSTNEEDKKMYEQIAKKMMSEIYFRQKGDETELWREWRFGRENIGEEDVEYGKKFHSVLDFFKKGSVSGGVDEVDSDSDVSRLKSIISEIKKTLISEAVLSEGLFGNLGKLSGEVVSVDGKEFVVSVEKFEGNPVLVFSSGEEKYGLKYSGFGKALSDLRFWNGNAFDRVQLRYFPVLLVRADGSRWFDVGDEGIYRLPEKYFLEVYQKSLIREFLLSKCL